MIPVFLFEREVLRDGLHYKVGCGEGGLAAGGQHQLAQGVRHKGVPCLQKRMPKNVVFTGLSHKCFMAYDYELPVEGLAIRKLRPHILIVFSHVHSSSFFLC
jgi:hypothetical protein